MPEVMNNYPVALESTVLSHGLPRPANLATGRAIEQIVREAGAHPVTIGYRDGAPRLGLDDADLSHFCTSGDIRKTSVKDIPAVIAGRLDGATTVSATMHVAFAAGIRVVATGGIGGVHPGDALRPDAPRDESSDLTELSRTPLTVVCSGPKAILDLESTRERLETLGIPVIGYRTDRMPAFYCTPTDLPVDARADSVAGLADIVAARDSAGLRAAVLVVNPLPEDEAIPLERIRRILREMPSGATRGRTASGLAADEDSDHASPGRPSAGALTPYVLARVRDEIGPRALDANISLLKKNARLAARLAVELGRRA
jgi:pseudouridine-5'-phosphate glycosidase